MSIKIRNGRVIRAPIGRVYDMLMQAKPEIGAIGRELEIGLMADMAARAVDMALLKDERPPEYPLFDAWTKLLDDIAEIRKTGYRNPRCDFSADAWIFPMSMRKTLVLLNTEQRRMQEWFDALSDVEDYAYWNDTDRDEGTSENEWRQRQQDWMRAMPIGSAPSDRCLTMTLYNPERAFMAKAEEALPLVKPLERRIDEHALNRHVQEVYDAMIALEREKDPDFKPDGFSMYFKAERTARTDMDRRAAIRAEVAGRLRPLTPEDLGPRPRAGKEG